MTTTVRTIPAARLTRPTTQARPTPRPRPRRSAVPYEHQVLFREPVYTDGQPYAAQDDDLEDENGQ
ncbi:hypothetical protein SUDANB145_07295 (plasmid) [Streptomyces sp. enrichment culture]|uniref:hypothetical protein n=1 Tax=Streptomyces sp. enrichment culture TaxID=1795815 RepID=UPI003F5660E8